VWFTHNDSGGKPELFAFTLDGGEVEKHRVRDADAEDWEDMAAGPCPDGVSDCLYVADIGDNFERRKRVQVYAITVPTGGRKSDIVAKWRIKYPDGPRNAETLLVHPITGAITIVTKQEDGHSEVYRIPRETGKVTAEYVATLGIEGDESKERLVTGGDWSSDGSRVVIRTYTAAYEWQVDTQDVDANWAVPARKIILPIEKQGEAIAYLPDGRWLTSSEGQPMWLHVISPITNVGE
jgi:hypothetical protein